MKFWFLRKQMLLLGAHFIYAIAGFSQSSVTSSGIDAFEKIPKTPSVASFAKMKEFPVNLNSGLIDVSIPLYTIRTGSIELPIYLSYAGGGIRVNELASRVGMGWSLNAGGVITKQINGLDDMYAETLQMHQFVKPDYTDFNGRYETNFNSVKELHDALAGDYEHPHRLQRFLGQVNLGRLDTEPDLYVYGGPSGSGSFLFDQSLLKFRKTNRDGTLIFLEDNTNSDNLNAHFSIQDTRGVVSKYGAIEKILNPLLDIPGAQPRNTELPNAWHLSEVGDGIHNKTVRLYYNKVYREVVGGYSHNRTFASSGFLKSNNHYQIRRKGDDVELNRIEFPEGWVEFIEAVEPQSDYPGISLKEIRIYNAENRIIKAFQFNYSYHRRMLFLSSIREVGYNRFGIATFNEPYVFTYDFSQNVPDRFSYGQDKWGYANGKLNNQSLIPDDLLIYPFQYPEIFGDRSLSPQHAKAGILQKIVYPTKGEVEFQYGQNYMDGSPTGGLRIERQIFKEKITGSEYITEYEYNNSGSRAFEPSFIYSFVHLFTSGSDLEFQVSSNPVNTFFTYTSTPVQYSEVSEIKKGPSFNLLTKHFYSEIQLGETFPAIGGVPQPKNSLLPQLSGKEYKTEYYKFNSISGLYDKQKSLYLDNVPINGKQDKIWGIQAAWNFPLSSQWAVWDYNDPYTQGPTIDDPMNLLVGTNSYSHLIESVLPIQKVETDELASVVTSNVEYIYDASNSNVKKQTVHLSNGDKQVTEYTYANDYPEHNNGNSWDYSFRQLREYNLITAPVEIYTYLLKGQSEQKYVISGNLFRYEDGLLKTVYKLEVGKGVTDYVETVNNPTQFVFDSRYKLSEEILSYSNKRLPSTIKKATGVASIIYDPTNEAVLASVRNAAYEDVFYNSFEYDEWGIWNTTGDPVFVPGGVTGFNALQLEVGQTVGVSVETGKKYKVSFWSPSSTIKINGLTPLVVKERLGWTLYTMEINGVDHVTISGEGIIDEVRIYPPNARMTTFTYHKAENVHSSSSEADEIVYYYYDIFDRLLFVKDDFGNIREKYCYSLAGQATTCELYYSEELSRNFQKNNCLPGGVGESLFVSLPDSMFTSTTSLQDANQKALDFGQMRANTELSCTYSTIPIYYTNTGEIVGTTVTFTNQETYQQWTYEIQQGSDLIAELPPGTYNIAFDANNPSALLYFATCSYYGFGSSVTFYNVVLDLGCNQIEIGY